MNQIFEEIRITLLKSYNKIYDELYQNGYKTEDVEKGDKLALNNKALALLCNFVRKDITSSDREIAALYLWAKENNLTK